MAAAEDNVAVTSMEVVVDGITVYTTQANSLAISIRLEGKTTVQVFAYDAAGNKGAGPIHVIDR